MISDQPAIILFDLGNVLININPDRSIENLVQLSSYSYRQIYTYFTSSRIVQSYEKGNISSNEFYQSVSNDLHLSIPEKQFKRLWQTMFFPNVPMVDFLGTIQSQFKCCCLSNTNQWHIEYCKISFPFFKWFHHCFFSHELKDIKPNKTIYQTVLNRLNEPPRRILFIDDKLENIRTAEEMGLHTIHFTTYSAFLKAWENIIY